MAEADKDGRAAQIVGDLMATAVMAVNEAWREAVRACPCGRPDCIATASPPVWHPATLGVNEFGTPVSIHVCRGCGHEFSVCPANLDYGDECLGETCSTYDIARDADLFFEPAVEAGWIRRGPPA